MATNSLIQDTNTLKKHSKSNIDPDSYDISQSGTQQEYWENRLRLFKRLLGAPEKIKKRKDQ